MKNHIAVRHPQPGTTRVEFVLPRELSGRGTRYAVMGLMLTTLVAKLGVRWVVCTVGSIAVVSAILGASAILALI